MRTLLLTLTLLCCATMAEAAWRPAKQALIVTAPEGMECIPCERLQQHIKAEYEGVRVGPERDSHFIVRHGSRELGKFPQIWYYDAQGRLTERVIGYQHKLYYNESLPERERLAALRKIVEKHPEFIPDRPPMAPPVMEVVSREAPVRTAELVTMADDGTVQIPESEELRPYGREIQTVQFSPFASDCSGSQAFAMPQTYSMPYSDCSGGGGGGIGGGGGDFFTPPAQSAYMMPQQYANYGLSFAQPYLQQYVPRQQQQYVVRYVPPSYSPRATMPQFAQGGINNFALVSIQPQLGLGTLFGGGLGSIFGQRAYSRRVPYRTAAYSPFSSYRMSPYRASPFSFASYGRSSRMVCGPSGCVMY